jgi:hypothetical protein
MSGSYFNNFEAPADAQPGGSSFDAAPKFVRSNKRRNGMIIPGTSDPLVAKMFADTIKK